jgi:hypothetical protein
MKIVRWTAAILSMAACSAWAQMTYQWTDITPAAGSAQTVAVHPLDGRRLLVVITANNFQQAVQASNDGGETWSAAGSPAPSFPEVHRLFAHPGAPGVVFLQTEASRYQLGVGDPFYNAGVTYRSGDFGATWQEVFHGSDQQLSLSPFASSPLDVDTIFATRRSPVQNERMTGGTISAEDSTVVVSRDGGGTWSSPGSGLSQLTSYVPSGKTLSEFDNIDGPTPAAPTRLFFTAGPASGDLTTYVTNDSGASWSPFRGESPGRFKWVRQDPRNAVVLYALRQPDPRSGAGQVLRSDDGGQSWNSVFEVRNEFQLGSFGGLPGPTLTIDRVDSRNLWLSGLTDGVFHSADGGRSWTFMGFAADLNAYGTAIDFFSIAREIVLNPSDSGVAYVIKKGRLYRGTPSPRSDPVITEFYYDPDRYWVATTPGEALSQDYREQPGNVRRTGLRWGGWRADDAPAGAVGSCRFWPQPYIGHSRVLVQQGSDCEALKRDPGWILEAENEFFTMRPVNNACPANTVPVRRFLNLQPDFNHRWVADPSLFDQMRVARAWADEGVRFCARPLGSNE